MSDLQFGKDNETSVTQNNNKTTNSFANNNDNMEQLSLSNDKPGRNIASGKSDNVKTNNEIEKSDYTT